MSNIKNGFGQILTTATEKNQATFLNMHNFLPTFTSKIKYLIK